ncbi:MAG: hypothetical protein NTZ51_11125, partial [Proteobacteria bacterium]|nr:hypothetical protein [Pseudomonadota bacterium]
SSASDVFAVGCRSYYAPVQAILHYNGSTWSSIGPDCQTALKASLGVWGSSASDVFAVGFRGEILHYKNDTNNGSTCVLTSINPDTIKVRAFLPRFKRVVITGEDSSFNVSSRVTIENSQGKKLSAWTMPSTTKTSLEALVIVPAGTAAGTYGVTIATGEEVCTGVSLIIEE